jgi:outer membrane protein W
MPRTLLLTMILILASPGLIFAEDNEDYDRNGFYIGAGVVGVLYMNAETVVEDARLKHNQHVSADIPLGVGMDLRTGFRLDERVAIEAQVHIIPETDVEVDGIKKVMALETVTATLNAKYFVLTGRLQPFVTVGIGLINFDIEEDVGSKASEFDSGPIGRFGGGVDYYLNRNVVVSADANYLHATGHADDMNHFTLSLGMQYRF